MSSVSSREARRRKIKESGSDRLALITGRIQNLPPSTYTSLPSVHVSSSEEIQASAADLPRDDRGGDFNDIDVNPSLGNPEFPLQKSWAGNECKDEAPILEVNDVPDLDNPEFPLQKSRAGSEREDEAPILEVNDVPEPSLSPPVSLDNPEFPLQKCRAGNESKDELPILEVNDVPEPSLSPPVSLDNPEFPLQRSRAGNECEDEAPILEVNNVPEPSSSSPASQQVSQPALHAERPSSLLPHRLKSFSFSPSELRSAVDHTANARMLCSVSVAILVVLSFMGFPLIGGKVFGSVLMFRPLYLVLITNITLVIARMILTQQSRNASSMNGEGKSSPGGDNDWVNQIGNNLELGFLLMKVMDAVVMDCSLYSAIVVCGTCLARLFT